MIRKCSWCNRRINEPESITIKLGGKKFHRDCAVKGMQARAKKIVLPKSVVESAKDMMFELGWFNLHKYKGKINTHWYKNEIK